MCSYVTSLIYQQNTYTVISLLIVMECEAPDSIPHGSVQVLVKESFFVGARRQKDPEDLFRRAAGVRQEEQVRGEERFPEGSMAEYSCGPGYCLHPASRASRTCHHGIWSGKLPQCGR